MNHHAKLQFFDQQLTRIREIVLRTDLLKMELFLGKSGVLVSELATTRIQVPLPESMIESS
jgi:hypothetical protein